MLDFVRLQIEFRQHWFLFCSQVCSHDQQVPLWQAPEKKKKILRWIELPELLNIFNISESLGIDFSWFCVTSLKGEHLQIMVVEMIPMRSRGLTRADIVSRLFSQWVARRKMSKPEFVRNRTTWERKRLKKRKGKGNLPGGQKLLWSVPTFSSSSESSWEEKDLSKTRRHWWEGSVLACSAWHCQVQFWKSSLLVEWTITMEGLGGGRGWEERLRARSRPRYRGRVQRSKVWLFPYWRWHWSTKEEIRGGSL